MHPVHVDASMSEYDPGPHTEHAVALATAEIVPGKHDEHAVEVAFAANLPASQTSHWTDAEVLEYEPATQLLHIDVWAVLPPCARATKAKYVPCPFPSFPYNVISPAAKSFS